MSANPSLTVFFQNFNQIVICSYPHLISLYDIFHFAVGTSTCRFVSGSHDLENGSKHHCLTP